MAIQTWKNVPFDASEHPYAVGFWPCDAAVAKNGTLPNLIDGGPVIQLDQTSNGARLDLNANGVSLDVAGGTATVGTVSGFDLTGKDWIIATACKAGSSISDGLGLGNPATGILSNDDSLTGVAFPGSNNFAGAGHIVLGAGGYANASVTDKVSDANLHNQFIVFDASGNVTSSIDGTEDSIGLTAASTVGDLVVADGSLFKHLGVSELYGIAILAWDAGNLPANYANVMAYMFDQWRSGNKILPPMWRGLS